MTIVLNVRNVNDALHQGVQFMRSQGVKKSSRNGDTLEVPFPVITHYRKPWERVLFNAQRDANPFFHLFESLWMLAGRNDIAFPAHFVKRMADYSDNGVTQPGAYGHRWRNMPHANGDDQIKTAIERLRKDPDDRRVVLQMWQASRDYGTPTKDAPCNTQIYLKVRDDRLQMSVLCRSNDVIWGAYGANAVHFTMLQEYIAAHLGLRMGSFTQFSDSWHVYISGPGGALWDKMLNESAVGNLLDDPYDGFLAQPDAMSRMTTIQMEEFDVDLAAFFKWWDKCYNDAQSLLPLFKSHYFRNVVGPMWLAHASRSQSAASLIRAPDWRMAAMQWLQRREKKI